MGKNYKALAQDILEHVGGSENVVNAMHCYTRLRINCKDVSLVELEEFAGEQLQIIIGNDVNEVYDAFVKLSGAKKRKCGR